MGTKKSDKIIQELNRSIYDGFYKLDQIHFRVDENIHSNTYYFIEKYIQNKSKCEILAEELILRLKSNGDTSNITFVGFMNHTGLCLNYVTKKLENTNYTIVEIGHTGLSWQFIPKFKEKLVIILPVTCTFASYFRIRNWILKQFVTDNISSRFYNLFTVLDRELKNQGNDIIIVKKHQKLANLYQKYNWSLIEKDKIVLGEKDDIKKAIYESEIIIRIYSELQVAESCKYCYPEKEWGDIARPIVQSHPYIDIPNQILSLPFFDSSESTKKYSIFHKTNALNEAHVYGNLSARGGNYLSYIRGNVFYSKNKKNIISFFRALFIKICPSDIVNITFITSDGGKSSNFLEDFIQIRELNEIEIEILRFNPNVESIETFMFLNQKALNSSSLIIYFEDVIAGAKTFKLLSDYIKHYRVTDRKKNVINRHGFDYVWALIDRTNYFTKSEVIKKLKSSKIKNPQKRLVVFRNLNVPILSSFHFINPLKKRLNDLEKISSQCHLDYLRISIAKEIEKNRSILLPEFKLSIERDKIFKYFPFHNIEDDYKEEVLEIYSPYFIRQNNNLLKLYISDKINSILSDLFPKITSETSTNVDWFSNLIEELVLDLDVISEKFLISSKYKDSKLRNKELEKEYIVDTLIKILTRYPFHYYKEIKDRVFVYVLEKLEKIHTDIPNNTLRKFRSFRQLKFFVKRSVELGSSFIFSKTFLFSIKQFYNFEKESLLLQKYKMKIEKLHEDFNAGIISENYWIKSTNNIRYKREQLLTYFEFILLCYKELIMQEPSRSIYLEKIINDDEILPEGFHYSNQGDINDLIAFLKDKYLHFTGAIKAENLYLIHDLIKLHTKNIKSYNFNKKSRGYLKKYYFISSTQKDPVIINIRKLINKSIFYNIENQDEVASKINELKRSYAQMLIVVNRLLALELDYESTEDFHKNLIKLLDEITKIISPLDRDSLQAGLFYGYGRIEADNPSKSKVYYCHSGSNSSYWDESVSLEEKGFIYSFMKGIYNRKSYGKLQSFIAGMKIKGKWHAFDDEYFDKNTFKENNKSKNIDNLIKIEESIEKTKKTPRLFSTSNMFMAIRLSSYKENKYEMSEKGNAVLIFTINSELKVKNFLDFISNEKFRLLFAIKKIILEHLEKQFNNTAFIEVLLNRSKVQYQKSLRHQLGTYYNNLEIINEQSNTNKLSKLEFNITLNAIRSQTAAYDSKYILGEKEFLNDDLENLIKTVFYSKSLGKQKFHFFNLDINIDSLFLPTIIYNVVIPQLLINIKQYTSNKPNQIVINITPFEDGKTTQILMKNVIATHKVNNTVGSSKREGRQMCLNILQAFNNHVVKTSSIVKKVEFKYYIEDKMYIAIINIIK